MPNNRRASYRFPVSIQARLEAVHDSRACTVRDMSESGVFVETEQLPKTRVGEVIDLKVDSLLQSLRSSVSVVVVRQGADGIGLRFL